MTQAKLATLEEIILHPSDWDGATNYFLDHFATVPAFLEMSKKTSLPIIIKMMGELAKHLFQKDAVALVNPMMFKVKLFHMIHGTCLVEGRLITFVYLTTVHKGVFSVGNLTTHKMEHSSRVSALPLDHMDDEDEMYQEPWNANPN
ncbi:MAG: hypothetical protein ACKVU2_08195 [Saprospiraceae bacterium]